MEQTFNLSTLTKFLHQTLAFTEEVKNVLKSNCDEAIFSLKPWHKEIITKQDVSKNACIFSNPEISVEEIAAGISRALLQTQQLREKLSVMEKPKHSITKTNYIEFDKKSTTSTNELKDLIQRVSSESNNCTFSNMNNAKCSVLGTVTSQVIYEQSFITMGVIDSLNAFNIPGGIIKSLKAYHTYLDIEFSEKSIDNGKRQKMLNIFLIQFNKIDKIVQNKLMEKTHDTSLLIKFISLFQNLFTEDIKICNLSNIKKVYTELNNIWKIYETKEFMNLHNLESDIQNILFCNTFDTTGWMSNGIWNFFYNRKFEENVLSNMMFFDSTEPEYVKIYKMICVLYQGLNPKIPILVQADK
ncbi:uncharacterized protein LOC143147243 [Ptiloglossa arizonensis]|uniref:uncharacterized protein LOC143147243 n=1 Tax=Ptiloglossa arizonensis TaxID=3350558 RepID=UPI003FA083E0